MDSGRVFLHLLFAIVAIFVFVIVQPFLEYVLLALILAYVLFPFHAQLVQFVRRKTPASRAAEPLSALTLILGSFVAIVLPLLYVLTAFLHDLRELSRGDADIQTGVLEAQFVAVAGVDVDVSEMVSLVAEWLFAVFFGDVSGLVATVLHAALGMALVLFLVFYLLIDGSSLVAWLTEASPLAPRVSTTLIDQIDRTTWGAVIGHTFAAVVQALVAGIGLHAVGIPNVVFWTIVMVILAFLPLIGVFIVWAPAAGYLFLVGEVSAAVFLALYGFSVVSFIDYYVRPIVIDKRARLNPAVILVGVFGGVYTLGFVGLFVGPILIGVLVAIVETFRTEYRSSARADVIEPDGPRPTETGEGLDSTEGSPDDRPPSAG